MGIGALNSQIYKRGYVTEEMEAIWTERALVARIFDVEATLARVQSDLGIVPADAARRIRETAKLSDDLIADVESGKVGNPLVAVLDALRSRVPEECRGWVHYGATTQDVLDTARALQIQRSTELMLAEVEQLIGQVSELSQQHASTLMVARTNGQHALPTTLGMRFARWLAELRRSRSRLIDMRGRTELIQFSGAAGTYASLGDDGPRVSRGLAKALGLVFEPIPWHAAADVMAEVASTVAIHGQTLAKIAEDLFDMQQTDTGEAHEAVDAHSSGSSTMPQKLNPFTTMKTSVGARLAAGMAATVLTQPPASYERDHRQSEVQRDLIPQIYVAVEGASAKLIDLLGRIHFETEALRHNLDHEGVLLMTEGIMMALAPRLGQEGAHDLLQTFAAAHRSTGVSLDDFIAARPDIAGRIEGIDIAGLSQPQAYIGLSERISRQVSGPER
ncbi:lyase family protein [Acidipropionibacterium virtanenii]|uniref:3-carboxy-cis,cis-muconate cycloisomerase n=1 Tax=Acidipropionibacterium virtanenii TaxID=2057246 RepID=A0A344UXQ6_9ACTN|nr:lyase family protein [Acidipropionibacterium virtanenii]AXE40054.1 3-carboxy-cis,cis-muconate cycloisomerase [Acidipropionibacterium virtanenii]